MKFNTLALLTFTSGIGCSHDPIGTHDMCLIAAQLTGGTEAVSVFALAAFQLGVKVVEMQIDGWPPAACVERMLQAGDGVFQAFLDRVVATFGAEIEIEIPSFAV